MPSFQLTHKKTLYNGSTLLPSALASAHFLMQFNATSLPHGQTLPPKLSVTTCVLLFPPQKGTSTNNANDSKNPPSMKHHHHCFLLRATSFILQSLTPTNQQALPTVILLAITPSNPIMVPTTFSSSMSMTVTPFSYTHSSTAAPTKSNTSSLASMVI